MTIKWHYKLPFPVRCYRWQLSQIDLIKAVILVTPIPPFFSSAPSSVLSIQNSRPKTAVRHNAFSAIREGRKEGRKEGEA